MEQQVTLTPVTLEDKVVWNNYVTQHADASAYHQFAWAQAVHAAYHHENISVMAKHPHTGEVMGVFPAVLMHVPVLGKKVCALPYCDVGYGLANTPEILDAMHEYLQQMVTHRGAKKLEIRDRNKARSENTSDHALKKKKARMLLQLPTSSETLMAGFKSKLRSQIRKAEKNGLVCILGTEHQHIEHFYSVYAQNMRDLGSPVHAKKWFYEIINAYGNQCLISVVYSGNQPVGGGLIIKNGASASIPWASTLREYNKLAPNMLLYWSLLAHCADNNIRTFDFGRSTFNEGTYKFKKQWGAEPQLLHWKSYDHNGIMADESDVSPGAPSKIRTTAERIWRQLPLSITVAIGATVRPYISL